MKQRFIKQTGSPNLLVFFAGWGADEHLFNTLSIEHHDCLLCYDYRELTFDYSLLHPYTHCYLAAWSMGVWVAEYLSSQQPFVWEYKFAFNGTPTPIDDNLGIPVDIFTGTLENFSEKTLAKFRRRMCGSSHNVKQFLSLVPQRTLPDLCNELSALQTAIRRTGPLPPSRWDCAIIGKNDRIFPVVNQQKAWRDHAPICLTETAHYDADTLTALITLSPDRLMHRYKAFGEEGTWTKV